MPELLVCCVMLTKDRPAMARRAVECFRQQGYENKRLLIYNTGHQGPLMDDCEVLDVSSQIHEPCIIGADADSIGELRNGAIQSAEEVSAEIIIHWDDDDWSHPERIAEQVALLRSSGADCVGYREMLFWRDPPGEAWIYTNSDPRYCLGTSLCYRRGAWERQPFRDIQRGEDHAFWCGLNSAGVLSLDDAPRMIASIHGSNTCGYTEATLTTSINWRRAPEWDDHCRRTMNMEVSV